MRVRQPEVEGDGRGLDQQPGEDQHERGEDQGVPPGCRVQLPSGLRHAEFAGARVQQADAQQRGVAAEGVDEAEVQCALYGPGLLDPVAGEGVADDAHQLEEHEGVEEVAGEREAAHARLEQQDERGVGAGVAVRRFVEVVPGVDEYGQDEQ
ncbi:hypothetical protein GCM10020000_73150 [Streptomyces olivoverticillatus]